MKLAFSLFSRHFARAIGRLLGHGNLVSFCDFAMGGGFASARMLSHDAAEVRYFHDRAIVIESIGRDT